MKSPTLYLAITFILLLFGSTSGLAQETLAQGSFEPDSYFINFEGSWEITQEAGKTYLLLKEDFQAKKAPDLKLFFSKLALDEIDGSNAAGEASLLLSPLQQFKGAQRYLIPDTVDLAGYQSLILHCEQYSKLWGGAPLR